MLKHPVADPRYISIKGCKRIHKGLCTICAKPINESEFNDASSKREYTIAGTCQKCQDKVYDSR